MATTLWPEGLNPQSDTMPELAAYTERRLTTTAPDTGGGSNVGVNLSASGDHIEMASGGTARLYLYRVNAVTISGTVSFSGNANESAMTSNACLACRIVRIADGTTTIASDVVDNTNAGHKDDAEMPTSTGDVTWTATPTSTAFSDGDWLGVIWHADAFGTMGSGTANLFIGAVSAPAPNTFVTFTETITAYTPATYSGRPDRQMPQLLAH